MEQTLGRQRASIMKSQESDVNRSTLGSVYEHNEKSISSARLWCRDDDDCYDCGDCDADDNGEVLKGRFKSIMANVVTFVGIFLKFQQCGIITKIT